MTNPDIEQIARGLSEAQRKALVSCAPWDVEVGAGIAIAFCANNFLEESTILDEGVQLTPLGLAVRYYLEKSDGAKD